jgi:hypothetical protein
MLRVSLAFLRLNKYVISHDRPTSNCDMTKPPQSCFPRGSCSSFYRFIITTTVKQIGIAAVKAREHASGVVIVAQVIISTLRAECRYQ